MPLTDSGQDIRQETLDDFVMPRVIPGMVVRFWRGSIMTREAVAATVLEVGARTISISTALGTRGRDCRHRNDPKLLMNRDIREDGCWDFTEQQVADEQFREDVSRRLDEIEDKLARLTVDAHRDAGPAEQPKEKKPSGFALLARLRQEAVSLGLTFEKDISMGDLQALIDTHKAANPK